MRLVPVKYLRVGSIIATDVLEDTGTLLIKKDQEVDAQMIQSLKSLGLSNVYITDQFCYVSNEDVYQRDMNVLYGHFRELRDIGKRVMNNATGITEIKRSYQIANDVITEVRKHGDFRLMYEPPKYFGDDYIEETIYMAIIATKLGMLMGLARGDLTNLFVATLLRDIGLISPKLFQVVENVEEHPLIGADFLEKTYKLDKGVIRTIREHHEVADGTGFPNSLKGKQISKLAHILGLVEKYFELWGDYDPVLNSQHAFNQKLKATFRKYDIEVLRYFLANIELFPLNTMVKLSDGNEAVVIKQVYFNFFSPEVGLIDRRTGEMGRKLSLVDNPTIRIANIIYYIS
ncbi:MAG: hypothetical protein ATN36_06835 [Epulopiscium sp. Nele67-Bin005]|nr:MAG: hypothetical protein ATN36_06835 [Epulopiscium sp. Nele67-Bin005]